MLLAAMLGYSFPTVMNYSLGLFLAPLGQEFGWSRMQMSASLGILGVATVLLSPLIGAIVDRWGSRKIAIAGTLLVSCAVAAFGLANGSLSQWLLLWTFLAFAKLAVEATVWTTAVTSRFSQARGLALGITLCGAALSQILAPPLSHWLIENFGWRMAFLGLGFGWGGVTLIFVLLFFYDAHDDRKDRAAGDPAREAPSVLAVLPGLSLRNALRNVALWRIGAASFVTMFVGVGVLVHQVPILTEAGLTRGNAALLASLSGVAAILGKLVTGRLMDGGKAEIVGPATLVVSAVGFALLLIPDRPPPLIVAAMIIIGYSTGAKLQISAYFTARYSGLRNLGKIFAVIYSIVALGSALGPVFAGAIYDHQGSYSLLLQVGIPASLLSGLLIARLGPFRTWTEDNEADVASPEPLNSRTCRSL